MRDSSEPLAGEVVRARRLVAVLVTHEADIAASVEARIFADGVPVPLTIAALMRAFLQQTTLAAEAMVRADIEYGKILAARHPDPRRTSLVS